MDGVDDDDADDPLSTHASPTTITTKTKTKIIPDIKKNSGASSFN